MTESPVDLRLYSLAEAAKLLGPGFKKRSLETERDNGRLRVVRLAGKDHVTHATLAALIEEATLCRDRTKARGPSKSKKAKGGKRTGSSAGTLPANDNKSRPESPSAAKAIAATLKGTRGRGRSRSAKA